MNKTERSVELVELQYRGGVTDFNRVYTVQAQLVTQQDTLATSTGNIALSLIQVYRGLGGGWRYFAAGGKGPPPAPLCRMRHRRALSPPKGCRCPRSNRCQTPAPTRPTAKSNPPELGSSRPTEWAAIGSPRVKRCKFSASAAARYRRRGSRSGRVWPSRLGSIFTRRTIQVP